MKKTILVGIRVNDLARSLEFYAALGYTELGTVPFDDGSRLVLLKFPGESWATLELVHRPADGPAAPGAGFDHLAVQVDELAATIESLTAAGLEPGPPELPGGPDGPKVAWITDPDGYRIELVEWPPNFPDGPTGS